MKTIILFTSHHCTTKKLAFQIAQDLEIDPDCDVDFSKNKKIDISSYDFVIIGSSIHAGSIPSDFKKFLIRNTGILMTKKIAIFMCGMEKQDKLILEFEYNFPIELRLHSIANGLLGGEFLFEKMNFLEKLIIKKISGLVSSKSDIDYNKYYDFIENLKLAT